MQLIFGYQIFLADVNLIHKIEVGTGKGPMCDEKHLVKGAINNAASSSSTDREIIHHA